MHFYVERLHLSPSDVTAFLASEHLTKLFIGPLRTRAGRIDRPEVPDEERALIFRKGSSTSAPTSSRSAASSCTSDVQDPPPPPTPGLDRRYGRAVDWNWLLRYRVWQASRKEFLAPENWLEPEQRDESAPPPPAPRSRFRRPCRGRSDADT